MTLRAFILMPLASEFDDIYEYLIRGAVGEAGFDVVRADDIRNQRNILADIVQAITDSDLIIADLSTANANVYYELGLAHAFGKHVILLAQDIEEVPFDLRSYRVVTYTTHFSRINEAREELKQLALGARDGTVQFGSPVSDFRALSGPRATPIISGAEQGIAGTKDDRGFLDFQNDLEDSFEVITNVLGEVGTRFQSLNPEIVTTGEQLQDSANTSSKKRRVIVRALASSLEEYAKWLRGGNAQYRQALARISESLNALFSGEFEIEKDALPQLRAFISTMRSIEQQAQAGRETFYGLVGTMESLPRIEKEFNRAKRYMAEELKELVNNIEQTVSALARARNAATQLLGDNEI